MKKKDLKIKEKNYFRSTDQLVGMKEYKQFVEREFPAGASEMDNAWSRRNFLTLMGASAALAGLAGCRRPAEKIVPYVKPPEVVIPGIAQHYATTMTLGANAYGIVVESHEGRPTKIEGNKLHASSNGAANTMMLSSILGLYDPDRSQKILNNNSEKSWEDFATDWQKLFEAHTADKGAGLAVVSGAYTSPTISRLRKQFEKQFPQASWATYEAVSDENIYNGIELATGQKLRPVYDYKNADVILALDSDFVTTESESLTASSGFSLGRNLEDENSQINRLYVAESAFSSTGAIADHRLPLKFNDIGRLTSLIAAKFGVVGDSTAIDDNSSKWLEAVVDDLKMADGKALVVAGLKQPAEVHALVFAINEKLNSQAVSYNKFNYTALSDLRSLSSLSDKINSDEIKTLVVLDCNPAYDAPIGLSFDRLIKKVENTIHFGLYFDETARLCGWHVPSAHYLEEWSDAEAVDGSLSIVQPLIVPLYGGKMKVEFLNLLATAQESVAYDSVRETWSGLVDGNFEKDWRKVLHDGVKSNAIDNSTSGKQVVLDMNGLVTSLNDKNNSELEIVFSSSSSVYDGRFANNGWLQELPDAVTRLSWDNAAQMSPMTAEKYGFKNEDLIRVSVAEAEVELPVWIVPGTVDDTIVTEFGYGRKNIGRIADKAGFDVYPLKVNTGDYFAPCQVAPTGRTYELANVQDHGSMEGRAIVREATLDEFKHEPEFAEHMVHHQPLETMWTEPKYDTGNQWGMAIDLTSCTGCNACVVACQSENNVPIIGKEEVRNGREMHWLRLDRYFVADEDDYKNSEQVEMVHQPVACHHCELAPCEQVCPVAATVHDDEGLNTMVYNRCIGTRYCSNNCPYKVRRFNFFNFTKETPEIVKMAMNPDVTVRSRGVMEKCTYCTQRIQRVKIEAKKEDREIRDGEVVVACQQACPSNAISFGNIRDENSKVAKVKKRNRNYSLLGELNIRPRTTYLAKVRNKNPKMG